MSFSIRFLNKVNSPICTPMILFKNIGILLYFFKRQIWNIFHNLYNKINSIIQMNWTQEETMHLLLLYNIYGNRPSLICQFFVSKSRIQIKSKLQYWKKKKMIWIYIYIWRFIILLMLLQHSFFLPLPFLLPWPVWTLSILFLPKHTSSRNIPTIQDLQGGDAHPPSLSTWNIGNTSYWGGPARLKSSRVDFNFCSWCDFNGL